MLQCSCFSMLPWWLILSYIKLNRLLSLICLATVTYFCTLKKRHARMRTISSCMRLDYDYTECTKIKWVIFTALALCSWVRYPEFFMYQLLIFLPHNIYIGLGHAHAWIKGLHFSEEVLLGLVEGIKSKGVRTCARCESLTPCVVVCAMCPLVQAVQR